MKLVLEDTWRTGVTQLGRLATVPDAPHLCWLVSDYGQNVWQVNWEKRALLLHYSRRRSWVERVWHAPRKVGRAKPAPPGPAALERRKGGFHNVMDLVIIQNEPLVLDYRSIGWRLHEGLELLNLESKARSLILRRSGPIGPAAACTASLGKIAVGGADITVLERSTGHVLGELPGNTDGVTQMALSPDETLLATTGVELSHSSWVQLYDLDQWTLLYRWTFGGAFGITFHPNGQVVAVGGRKAHIKLWDLMTNAKELYNLRSPISISALSFTSDGQLLYAADWQGQISRFRVVEFPK